jgi:WD40 repeat protein
MGEVYRARDERLGREVAIKVLPAAADADADRLRRFEKEARSASSLNHPNIVTVYDVGESDGVSYIAMEVVAGRTLREILAEGALPMKRLLAIGAQIADGLARAHAAGIVHRDLKPENVMVTTDGFAKILDFGLAKLTEPETSEDGDQTSSPTATAGTTPGIVVGTVAYMSPEQALGKPLDFRSDQFSFGSVLYEMLTGRRAFQRRSGPETMTAIIREEPVPPRTAAPSAPVPLMWIVERCLAKEPDERYGSTRDLARDLARLREGLTEGSLSGAAAAPASMAIPRWRRAVVPVLATVSIAAIAAAVLALRRPSPKAPTYRPVSFHRGSLGGARFAPDGQTVLYSAAWGGKPAQIYSTRVDSTESSKLPLPSANLLSVSSTGKLAVLLLREAGPVIAEVPLAGGAPRELVATDSPYSLPLSGQVADWTPGGDRLAVVRDGSLEFPIGKVLIPAGKGSRVLGIRFSPDGKRIAFAQELGPNEQRVGVVDPDGKSRVLTSNWGTLVSLAWSPSGREVWFSGRKKDVSIGVVELRAVSLSGAERLVAQNPQLLIVEDVARDGRVLARSDDWPKTMMCLAPGASRETDLTWLDFSQAVAMSHDGRNVLFHESGAGGGATGGLYIRRTDGSNQAVRLGDGTGQDLSPDEKWVAQAAGDRVTLLPIGAGESRILRDEGFNYQRAAWFRDGKRLLLAGSASGAPPRMYVRDLSTGPPRPITPEWVAGGWISPDGRLVAAVDLKTGQWALYPVDGGEPRPIPSIRPDETLYGFDDTGASIYVASENTTTHVDRLDLATWKRTPVRDIGPADPTGVIGTDVLLARDGKSYCYSAVRALSRLYAVDGLR